MDARVEALVIGWTARDHARALVPEDHAAIDATHAARALVVVRLQGDGHADLFHACLVLGRLLAEHGGTPTLAAATIDGAIEATGATDITGAWLVSARAALAEGYAAARSDRARGDAFRAWEFPRCAVRTGERSMAFAAGAPDEDDEMLRDWASRVAAKAMRAKVRRAQVDGAEKPRLALVEALQIAGIEILTGNTEPGPRPAPRFRLPWLRREDR